MMNGADRKDLGKSQLGKLRRANIFPVIIDFVDRHERLLARPAQPSRNLFVQRHDPFLHVDDQDDNPRGFNGQFDLFKRRARNDIAGFFPMHQADAARIDQRIRPPLPFNFRSDAVAGHARFVMNDGNAAAGDAVEQGRFPHIGPADNGDNI